MFVLWFPTLYRYLCEFKIPFVLSFSTVPVIRAEESQVFVIYAPLEAA